MKNLNQLFTTKALKWTIALGVLALVLGFYIHNLWVFWLGAILVVVAYWRLMTHWFHTES